MSKKTSVHLISVFLKLPRPGKAKTRLAATIGNDAALAVYDALVAETLKMLPYKEADVAVWFDPPGAEAEIRAWLAPLLDSDASIRFFPQARGDLGQRMNTAVSHAFEDGYETVTLTGTDCPGLKARHFQQGWEALSTDCRAVFGPASDGGYYLLALNEPAPYLFNGIPWSSSDTLSASLEAAKRQGVGVHLLEELRDIDTAEDLESTSWKIPSSS
jgi:rSAM/selenodomain-associated transferase 1